MENEVGARLKTHRESLGMTTRDLARLVPKSQSYISKVEMGELHPKREYLQEVIPFLELKEQDIQSLYALQALWEIDNGQVAAREDGLTQRQRVLYELYATARCIKTFQNAGIPGSLQTLDYVKGVFEAASLFFSSKDADIVGAIDERMRRQELLKSSTRYEFIITEAALRNRICCPSVMCSQIDSIKRAAQRPNVAIQIVPQTAPLFVLPITNFVIVDNTVVLIDTATELITVRKSELVQAHLLIFNHLLPSALKDQSMLRFLDTIAEHFARMGQIESPILTTESDDARTLTWHSLSRLPIGSILAGTITKFSGADAYVELAPNVSVLVPRRPEGVFVGQDACVTIREIDHVEKRLSLEFADKPLRKPSGSKIYVGNLDWNAIKKWLEIKEFSDSTSKPSDQKTSRRGKTSN